MTATLKKKIIEVCDEKIEAKSYEDQRDSAK